MRKPGFHHTEETKNKIRYMRTLNNPLEHIRRTKISIALKGKPKSKEHCANVSKAKKGKKPILSEETRAKKRELMLTRNPMRNFDSLAKLKATKLLRPTRLFGEKNPAWRGDDIGKGVHGWLSTHYGKATKCELNPEHKSTRYHWANLDHRYSRNIGDYRQLCPSCHERYDLNQITISELFIKERNPNESQISYSGHR